MNTTKTLIHDQIIFAEAWGRGCIGFVGTVEGMCRRDGKDPTEMLDRAKRNGHAIAFAIKEGDTITNSRAYYDARKERENNATPLIAGECVEIEGRRYTVKLMGRNYSDFIHFAPTK